MWEKNSRVLSQNLPNVFPLNDSVPTNVPLWEIPIYALYSGYLWVNYPQESLENTS